MTVVGGHPDGEQVESKVHQELRTWFGPSTESWRFLRNYILPHALPDQSPAVLEPVERPGQVVIVANTHLYFHPDAGHIRLVQMLTAMTFIESLRTKYKKQVCH